MPQYNQTLSNPFNKLAFCPYCEEAYSSRPTRDHVVAKSKGGKAKIKVCSPCNNQKGAKPLKVFLLEKHLGDIERVERIVSNVFDRLANYHDALDFMIDNKDITLRDPRSTPLGVRAPQYGYR